jgi:hypothetical protein
VVCACLRPEKPPSSMLLGYYRTKTLQTLQTLPSARRILRFFNEAEYGLLLAVSQLAGSRRRGRVMRWQPAMHSR